MISKSKRANYASIFAFLIPFVNRRTFRHGATPSSDSDAPGYTLNIHLVTLTLERTRGRKIIGINARCCLGSCSFIYCCFVCVAVDSNALTKGMDPFIYIYYQFLNVCELRFKS